MRSGNPCPPSEYFRPDFSTTFASRLGGECVQSCYSFEEPDDAGICRVQRDRLDLPSTETPGATPTAQPSRTPWPTATPTSRNKSRAQIESEEWEARLCDTSDWVARLVLNPPRARIEATKLADSCLRFEKLYRRQSPCCAPVEGLDTETQTKRYELMQKLYRLPPDSPERKNLCEEDALLPGRGLADCPPR